MTPARFLSLASAFTLPLFTTTAKDAASPPLVLKPIKFIEYDLENGLHAHIEEDHIFVVLQGEAQFFGIDGQIGRASCRERVYSSV